MKKDWTNTYFSDTRDCMFQIEITTAVELNVLDYINDEA